MSAKLKEILNGETAAAMAEFHEHAAAGRATERDYLDIIEAEAPLLKRTNKVNRRIKRREKKNS